MNKNILIVTGGAGFIGSNLIGSLLQNTNHDIISLDNYSAGFSSNHLKSKRVKYIKGDIKNISKILSKEKKNIKAIFHFGEFSRIAQSFGKDYKVLDTNINGSYEVIKFCLLNKIKIIYSATSASFGKNFEDQHLLNKMIHCLLLKDIATPIRQRVQNKNQNLRFDKVQKYKAHFELLVLH